ncbi:putative ribosomal protein S8e/ribosomal biogenesis NSA2 [Rosa chinensis]|uniref:Putative ribosomal protein S8e/ribosomal biogenesis NSA2 n=1 Tax=Rosa chinensis TaxID=74649 RepID=A0A2P6PBS0_ROSCH|nr:putative ribosomal protein S8e/ribosomal biogenesis NSA2 [Rosa chinensis]
MRYGYRLDHFERKCKKEACEALGIKGKMFAKKLYAEKALMKKTWFCYVGSLKYFAHNAEVFYYQLAMHEESSTRHKVDDDDVHEGAVPTLMLDRDNTTRAKVRPVAEDEMFKVLRTGKRKTKQWKRMITKATFVNVSELGLVTPNGKVVWGKYAQGTNNPENNGCVNVVLLV